MTRPFFAENLIAPAPDDELGALAKADHRDNPAAFAALAQRVMAPVRRWAERLTGDPDEADDVTQLVLLRLERQVASFEGRSRFTTWLFRLTANVVHDRRATERRRAALREEHRHRMDAGMHEPDTNSLDHAAIADLVRSYRHRLTPRERQVFDLIDIGGADANTAAQTLGIAPSTVRVLLSRARRTIRLEMLAEHPGILEEYHP